MCNFMYLIAIEWRFFVSRHYTKHITLMGQILLFAHSTTTQNNIDWLCSSYYYTDEPTGKIANQKKIKKTKRKNH